MTVKGEILIIRFLHNWNLEGAKVFFREYKKRVRQHNFKQYGVLSDLRSFEGSAPEVIDYFKSIADWAEKNGQVGRALIMDSMIKELTINEIDKGKQRFPVQVFSEKNEALKWLKSLGLSTS